MLKHGSCLGFVVLTSHITECNACGRKCNRKSGTVRKAGERSRSILSILSCRFWRCFWQRVRNWKEKKWSISGPRAYFLELLLEGNTAVTIWKMSYREMKLEGGGVW